MANRRDAQVFKHELKIKRIPVGGEQYCRQYFINLLLQGYIIVSPDGAIMDKSNLDKAMEAWG